MKLYWYDHLSACVTLSTSSALCLRSVRSREAKRWKWMQTFALFTAIQTLVCGALQEWLSQFPKMGQHRTAYAIWFYTYWLTKPVAAVLGMAVLNEAARNLPLARLTPRNLRIVFGVATAIMTVGSFYFASLSAPNTYFLTSLAFTMQLCLAVASAAFGLSVVLWVSILGLSWSPVSVSVACGFLAQSVVYIACSYGASINPGLNRNLTLLNDLVGSTVIGYWAAAFLRRHAPEPIRDHATLDSLLSSLSLQSPNPSDREASPL